MAAFGRWLRAQPEIRVYVPGTPNYGHQSLSLLMARRMVADFGYAGTLTIICQQDLSGGRPTLEKLSRLLGAESRMPERLGDARVRWLSEADIPSLPWRPFALSGGFASVVAAGAAEQLRVGALVGLQPIHWRYDADFVVFDDRTAPIVISDRRGLAGRAFRTWDVTRPPRAGAPRLATGASRVLACPIYGVREDGVSGLDPIAAFALIALAWLTLATRHGRSVALWNFDRASPALVGRLRGLCAGEAVGAPPGVRAALRRFRGRMAFAPARGAAGALRWAAAAPGRLAFIQQGFAPERRFIEAVAGATLPVVFEGQGAASTAISLGKPYLQLPDVHSPRPVAFARVCGDEGRHRAARRLAERCSRLLATAAGGKTPARAAVAALADFAETASLKRGAASAYFAALGRDYAANPDKLEIGLEIFMTLLRERERRPAAPPSPRIRRRT